MITFKNFLAEQNEFDFDKFKTDCKFFIDELKSSRYDGKTLLYRGAQSIRDDAEWEIRQYSERDKPRDSSQDLHDKLNRTFQDMFDAPIRNWMFASGDRSQAGVYSNGNTGLIAIFPIGKFEWVCGLDKDLYDMTTFAAMIRGRLKDSHRDLSYDERGVLAHNLVAQKVRHMHWEHNTNLTTCLQSGNEIMIKCGKYYAIGANSDLFRRTILPFFSSL